jgi:hypothetical protein
MSWPLTRLFPQAQSSRDQFVDPGRPRYTLISSPRSNANSIAVIAADGLYKRDVFRT